MKRYLLFCGSHYYPLGGWKDFVGSFDTLLEAQAASVARIAAPDCDDDWCHAVDATTGEEVASDQA